MSTFKHIAGLFNKELQDFNSYYKKQVTSKIVLLRTILNYFQKGQGKKVRPLLVLVSAKMFGDVSERTYTGATLIEILHNATLIHDDIVDESMERRGKLTLHAIWSTKISVLVGDYLLAKGLHVALQHKEYAMLEKISEVVQEMSEGELLQNRTSQKKIIDYDTYIEIITKKTAKLIEACFYCGALSSTSDQTILTKMSQLGLKAGIIFQLKDDLLDFESKTLTGKTQNNDIKNSKITLPILLAFQKSTIKEQKGIIKKLYKKHKKEKDIIEILTFIEKHNGLKESLVIINQYCNDCCKLLDELPETSYREQMRELIIYFSERNK